MKVNEENIPKAMWLHDLKANTEDLAIAVAHLDVLLCRAPLVVDKKNMVCCENSVADLKCVYSSVLIPT